jgi:hypothetical protein
LLLVGLVLLLLPGCSNSGSELKSLMKSDIDIVADAHLGQVENLLKDLAIKLYWSNPGELKKGQVSTLRGRHAQLFDADRSLVFAEIGKKRGVPAIMLALDTDYRGDRVFPLMVGLISMVRSSYNDLPEFFLLDSLDPQKLYNSARNLEVLVRHLEPRPDADSRPLVLNDDLPKDLRDLSYERLFGKLIAHQDMMALIAESKWDRTINRIVHSAATAVFLPVGL